MDKPKSEESDTIINIGKIMMDIKNAKNMVRIVHPGGAVEIFSIAITAKQIMDRYPKFCVTTPDVFERPWEAVVGQETILMPGDKFFLVPLSTVRKLQRKQCSTSSMSSSAGSEGTQERNSKEFDHVRPSGPNMPMTKKSKRTITSPSRPQRSEGEAFGNGKVDYSTQGVGSLFSCARDFYANLRDLEPEDDRNHTEVNSAEPQNVVSEMHGVQSCSHYYHRKRRFLTPFHKNFKMRRDPPWYPKLPVIDEVSP
eukprot:Gb_22402 [translate_table: standard]